MALSSDEILNKSFQNVRRGFDPEEVKAFLRRVASEGVTTDGTGREVNGNDLDSAAEDVRAVLAAARDAAAKLRQDSAKEAQAMLDETGDKAADIRRNATQEATTTLEDARRRAEQLVEEAKAYAQEQRSTADRERREILDGAIKHHEQLMAQERELQEAAKRAEKALNDLNSALKSDQRSDQPQVINLDAQHATKAP